MKNILTLLFVLFGGYSLHAQDTCYGFLRNDTLTIGNNLVERGKYHNLPPDRQE